MKTDNILYLIGIGLFVFTVIFLIYSVITDPYIFCVTAKGDLEEIDNGTKCFKTISESKEYQVYIKEKYYKETPFDVKFDPSFLD